MMLGLEAYVRGSGIEHSLLELVKTRVSQINGCAYCLDMHSQDARAGGETEQRLHVLAAWREAPFYSDRERAALAWAEALTEISINGVTDELYAEVRQHFDEKALVDLTLAIVAINGWNRLAIPFRSQAGTYLRTGKRSSAG
jgi:AhpD family alkylhydroperoxidase